MSTLIALKRRRDSKADWSSQNTVLKEGQLGFEIGTGEFGTPRIKFGDGSTAWNDLPYINRKNNLTATTDPTTANDDSENYSVGSLWANVNSPSAPKYFLLTELASGATWVQIGGTGAGGGENLNETLVIGNTTGGEDIVVSDADVIDFTNASSSTNLMTFPNASILQHVASGGFLWKIVNGLQLTNTSDFSIVVFNTDGELEIGDADLDGTISIWDATGNFKFLIDKTTLTAARTETKPDADIDWTGATDSQVLAYDASTETWSPVDQSGGGGGGGEDLNETLYIGNTTGVDATTSGFDIVMSTGDVIDWTNANNSDALATFPDSAVLRYRTVGGLDWFISAFAMYGIGGANPVFNFGTATGVFTAGGLGQDGAIRIFDDTSGFYYELQNPANITGNRTITWPDGDMKLNSASTGDVITWTGTRYEPQPAAGGDISGPSTSTDTAIARWNGTDGSSLEDSGVLISDGDVVTGAARIESTVINQDAMNTLTDSSGFDWDFDDGNFAQLTLTADGTLNAATNLRVGTWLLLVKQNATGGWGLTFDASYDFPLGTPVLNDGANEETWISFACDGTTVTGVAITAANEGFIPEISTSVDNSIARWSNTTGDAITDSNITLSDADVIEGAERIQSKTFNQTSANTLTDTSGFDWDWDEGNIATIELTGNSTLNNPMNKRVGSWSVYIRQDGSGGHTLAFDTDYKFAGSTAPTITTDASALDVLTCVYDGTTVACSIVQNIG